MTRLKGTLDRLSNDQLLIQLQDLILRERTLEAELVAHLGEVDARRLYLEQACSSMFNYCVHVLHFAEGVAYKRIVSGVSPSGALGSLSRARSLQYPSALPLPQSIRSRAGLRHRAYGRVPREQFCGSYRERSRAWRTRSS